MGRLCVVADCPVTERTQSSSSLFNHVHPTAKGMMFKLSAERKKVWADLLHLERMVSTDAQLVCCRHFSMLQYNELRLSRGCRFHILTQEAYPDIFLPGQENSADAIMYKEIYPSDKDVEEEIHQGNEQHAECEPLPHIESNRSMKEQVKVTELPPETSLVHEARKNNEDFETNDSVMSNDEQGASTSEKFGVG